MTHTTSLEASKDAMPDLQERRTQILKRMIDDAIESLAKGYYIHKKKRGRLMIRLNNTKYLSRRTRQAVEQRRHLTIQERNPKA